MRLKAGERHSLHNGVIDHDTLIGRPEGVIVTTQMGARMLAVRPTFAEQVTGRVRQAQPIYPKDLGAILVGRGHPPRGEGPGGGHGHGRADASGASSDRPRGPLVSYEQREEFQEAARKAIVDTLGALPGNLALKLGDAYLGFEESATSTASCSTYPSHGRRCPGAKLALRAGGIVFAFCPNVSQVQRFFDCLREVRGFGMLEVYELLQRGWTVRGRSLRPSHRMVAHSGFLCFARRLAEDELFEPEGEGFR